MTLCPYCCRAECECLVKSVSTDRKIMIDYLLMKVRHWDWHGVSDAANDLREMDAREKNGG